MRIWERKPFKTPHTITLDEVYYVHTIYKDNVTRYNLLLFEIEVHKETLAIAKSEKLISCWSNDGMWTRLIGIDINKPYWYIKWKYNKRYNKEELSLYKKFKKKDHI